MNKQIFQVRGATTPLWNMGTEQEVRSHFQALKDAGGNSVIIDFHLTTPSLTSSSVTWQAPHEPVVLERAIGIAGEVGLDVWIKPIVMIGDDGLNWQQLSPLNPEQWFAQYTQRILESISLDKNGAITHVLLTNELAALTTTPSNLGHWTSLISAVRTQFSGEIGFNAGGLLGEGRGHSEFERIPDALYQLVDFVGISAYPRIHAETVEGFMAGWRNDHFGNDLVSILHDFFPRTDKPIYFTELGVAAVDKGNLGFYDGQAQPNPDYPTKFYQAAANVLASELSGRVEGVFLYAWSLSPRSDDAGGFLFLINHTPAVHAITSWFREGVDVSGVRFGTDGDDIFHGSGVGDVFHLAGGADKVFGYAGDDKFHIASDKTGSKTIDGGAGTDTIVYSGSRDIHTVQKGLGTDLAITVQRPTATDILVSIERIEFNDGALLFDVESFNAPAAYRLYGGAFARTPDEEGFLFWVLEWLDAGRSLRDAAAGFIASPEFIGLYGSNLSDAQMVDQLYLNVLGRPGETEGVAFWNSYLADGHGEHADVLVHFTQLPEYVANSQADIANGYWVT